MRHGRTEFTNSMPPYLLYADVRASGTDGGSTVGGAWTTRPLNTEVIDTHNLGTLSANQITLQPGTYRFRGVSILFYSGRSACRLWNVTDSIAPNQVRTSLASAVATIDYVSSPCEVIGRFLITSSKVFRLEYRTAADTATIGLGLANGFGDSECYATLEFWREP